MTEAVAAAPAIAPAITTPAEPDGAPRLAVLDILRGIAILGILFMNINDMGQSMAASFQQIRHLGWTPADQVAWWLREVLANGTARCLLEMLFGVGMVILTDRMAKAAEGRFAVLRRYWWRNIVLFVFGVAHMYLLLWPGDILHTYAMASLLAVLFRKLRPRFLIPIGLLMGTVQFFGAGTYVITSWQQTAKIEAIHSAEAAGKPISAEDKKLLAKEAKAKVERAKDKAEAEKKIADEDKGRSSDTMGWVKAQTDMSLSRFPDFGEIFSVWEALGTMLIGAALFKMGIIQGRRSTRFYAGMTLIGYAIGLSLRLWSAYEDTRFDQQPHLSWAIGEYARQAMTLGHIGAVQLLLGSAFGAALLKPFEAAGRTALSIYIGQTIICLWLLYPPFALHLYGQQGWMALMLTAVAVNAVLLVIANLWVRRYSMAPVEWAWRSIVEWRLLPMRKRVA